MKIIFPFLIIPFLITKISSAINNTNNTSDAPSIIISNMTNHLGILFDEVFSDLSRKHGVNKCFSTLSQYYKSSAETKLALSKLMFDSSKNKNDVGTSSKCRNNNYETIKTDEKELKSAPIGVSNFDYLIIRVTDIHSIRTDHYGICFLSHNDCSENDYILLTKGINDLTNVFYDKSDNPNECFIEIFNMKDLDKTFDPIQIAQLLPSIFLCILSLCCIFPSVPHFLFKNCFSKTSSSDHFKKCFRLEVNGEELFDNKNESKHDVGLSYIKGIRGISMIFMLLGSIFSTLYSHPSRIIKEDGNLELYSHPLYSVIIFGERQSVRILLSCSGFCLVYKLFSYLDEKLAENDDRSTMSQENDYDSNDGNQKNLIELYGEEDDNNDNLRKRSSIDEPLEDKDPDTITWNYLFLFILYQLPKYLLTVFSLLIGKFSITPIMKFFFNVGPMYEIFKQRVINQVSYLELFGHMMIVQINFKLYGEIFTDKNRSGSFLEIFWMALNEIEFFAITSFLIFICYKKKLRLDLIALIAIIILMAIKIIMVLSIAHLRPAYYYYNHPYYYMSFLSWFNYQYYLIGVLFGMINYTIQNQIDFRDAVKKKKQYLLSIISVINIFKKENLSKTIELILLIGCSIILFFLFYFYSTLHYCGVPHETIKNISNFIFMFDMELCVVLLHCIIFFCYSRGESVLCNFLSNKKWGVANKIYFYFILTCGPLTMFIFYQSETRINVSYFSVLFYSLICGFFIFVASTLNYILFGLPYKKLIKLGINLREERLRKEKKERRKLI